MFPEYVSVSQVQSVIAKFNVFRVWQPSAMTERACPQLKTEWRNFLPERGRRSRRGKPSHVSTLCFHLAVSSPLVERNSKTI